MSLLTNDQYATLGAELADIPLAGETCPDCGDPSPGGAKCAACREWDSEERDPYPALYCYECGRQLRTVDDVELWEIHTDAAGEDVCEDCCEECNGNVIQYARELAHG